MVSKPKTLAHEMFNAKCRFQGFESDVEDLLDDWWPSVDHITTDYHDVSIGIYFEDHVVDLEPSPEQVAQFWTWGFDRVWLNFKGGKSKNGMERSYLNPRFKAALPTVGEK